jgi:hypothetical protein
MKLQVAISLINEDLGPMPEIRDMCISIVKYLASADPKLLRRVSFRMLQEITKVEDPAEMLPAVQYLNGARVKALALRFNFVIDDYEAEIDADVVETARSEGRFYHPETGDPVDNFESKIFVHFVPGKDGVEFAGAESE